jgi:hypothetical protein
MRRTIISCIALALLAAPAAGCVSSIEGAYDDQARSECDQQTAGSQRSDCYDKVDENRRRN